ncbi:hypothetical protein D9M71_586150 [compost metagenome]
MQHRAPQDAIPGAGSIGLRLGCGRQPEGLRQQGEEAQARHHHEGHPPTGGLAQPGAGGNAEHVGDGQAAEHQGHGRCAAMGWRQFGGEQGGAAEEAGMAEGGEHAHGQQPFIVRCQGAAEVAQGVGTHQPEQRLTARQATEQRAQ